MEEKAKRGQCGRLSSNSQTPLGKGQPRSLVQEKRVKIDKMTYAA